MEKRESDFGSVDMEKEERRDGRRDEITFVPMISAETEGCIHGWMDT